MSIEDDCSITFVQFPCRFRIRTDALLYLAPGAFRLRRHIQAVRPFDIGAIVVASEDSSRLCSTRRVIDLHLRPQSLEDRRSARVGELSLVA